MCADSDAGRAEPRHVVTPSEPASRQDRRAARQNAIADAVIANGSVRIEELAEQFKISLMTAHRDLDELQARGLLRKSRGVATAQATSLVESSVFYRGAQHLDIKRALAAAAMAYVDSGQSVLLDDSTTVQQVIGLLPEVAPLTVITNSLIAINQVTGIDEISVIGLGGEYHPGFGSFMGRMTNEAIGRLRSDVVLMSAAAIIDRTVYFQASETVDTKRAMLDASAVRVLLADHTKFSARALHALADLDEFDHVITDDRTPADTIDRLRESGIDLIVVPTPAQS
ncbi:DeoR/GlpR transcriptional regulator [Microlunatus elymi]|uniref:DeoR/GlpR transcriptional regulator n=2 Tax=Microlunatus elymi TaxID=2596828 RepID=A0A516Q5Q4_9ACTN|nr:DeoR/GlpR transcriptional regulator [Microlunatus elymi]